MHDLGALWRDAHPALNSSRDIGLQHPLHRAQRLHKATGNISTMSTSEIAPPAPMSPHDLAIDVLMRLFPPTFQDATSTSASSTYYLQELKYDDK